MRTIGVVDIEPLLEKKDADVAEDFATRKLIAREPTLRMDDGAVLYENRERMIQFARFTKPWTQSQEGVSFPA